MIASAYMPFARPPSEVLSSPPIPAKLDRCFANGVASFRAQSMKSCVTGLMIRFFKVTILMGPGWTRKSTGRAFNPRRLPLSRTVETGATDRKRPV